MINAIKIAIENGYGSYVGKKWEVKNVTKHKHRYTFIAEVRVDDELNFGSAWYRHMVIDNFLNDISFWKALGRGLGWEQPSPYDLTAGEQ